MLPPHPDMAGSPSSVDDLEEAAVRRRFRSLALLVILEHKSSNMTNTSAFVCSMPRAFPHPSLSLMAIHFYTISGYRCMRVA